MKKQIELNHINSIVAPHLVNLGFKPNKAGNLWLLKLAPWDVELNLLVTTRRPENPWIRMRSSIYRKDISPYLSRLDAFVREDRGDFPLKMKYPVYSISDWKNLYKEFEVVDSGIWFDSCREFESDNKFFDKFKDLISVLMKLFEKCKIMIILFSFRVSVFFEENWLGILF